MEKRIVAHLDSANCRGCNVDRAVWRYRDTRLPGFGSRSDGYTDAWTSRSASSTTTRGRTMYRQLQKLAQTVSDREVLCRSRQTFRTISNRPPSLPLHTERGLFMS